MSIQDGDVCLRGYLAYDDSKQPGILVMPEALELGAHLSSAPSARHSLATWRWQAIPMEGVEAKYLPEAMKYAGPLREDSSKFRKRGRVALDKLASLPQVDSARLAAIGFWMGRTLSLELARDGTPQRGGVTFHGGLETQAPAQRGQVKAKILVCTGADDPFVPLWRISK